MRANSRKIIGCVSSNKGGDQDFKRCYEVGKIMGNLFNFRRIYKRYNWTKVVTAVWHKIRRKPNLIFGMPVDDPFLLAEQFFIK